MRAGSLLALLFTAAVAYSAPPDPQVLADRIDSYLDARCRAENVEPAPPADDAEFLRRAYLDLTGRIPRPRDVHDFLADKDPAKRAKLIDDLIDTPRYSIHFANVWRSLLLPEAAAGGEARYLQVGLEAWLRQQMRANIPYDRMVRDLIGVPIPANGQEAASVFRSPELPNPLAFYAAKESKPENLAAATTRLFLGIQIECAQCHNHPFARWSREQFWNQAAFFAGIDRQGEGLFAPLTETVTRHELTQPDTKRKVKAEFLDETKPKWEPGVPTGAALADWITSPQNPYFAKAAVNRVWGWFFGRGIVDPVDDFHDDNKPSHPELLDDLARAFVESKFDLAYLVKSICRTKAYMRTSARTHSSQDDPRLFARMSIKGMTGEQFFDSLVLATGWREQSAERNTMDRERVSERARFLTEFARQGRVTEPETSILQALKLMNSKFLAELTDPVKGPALLAVCETPGMSSNDKVAALYLSTVSRPPTAAECERLLQYLDKGPKSQRLADILWMLLNSAEFRMNH